MRKPNMERFTGQTHQQPVVAKSMPGDRTKTCCDDRDIPHKEMFLPQLKECHTDTQELWQLIRMVFREEIAKEHLTTPGTIPHPKVK